jgi:hypothetical protein
MAFPATPSYSLGVVSGTMAAGLSAASPIVSIRWATVGQLCVIRSLRLTAGNSATAFTAGFVAFDLITARGWSANDTGGGAVAWTNTATNRRRSTFGDSGFATAGEIRVATTATLSAGTRTLDTNPLNSIAASVTATAGDFVLPETELVPRGAYPIVLSAAAAATAQGLVIRATVPATGTWQFSVAMDWEEETDGEY